jgi:hypothetical protein
MNHRQKQRIAYFSSILAVALVSACSSEDAPADTSGSTCTAGSSTTAAGAGPGAVVASDCHSTGENLICAPSGFPFVERVFAVTDECVGDDCAPPNPTLSEPEPGVLCMSGTAPPGQHARFPLILFRGWSDTLQPFDADALGITKLSFAIDSPPAGGLIVDAGQMVSLNCPDYLFECLAFGFELPRVTKPGTTTAPLADFLQSDSASQHQSLNTRLLSHIAFTVGEGAYDFCVRDFKFLNKVGGEVTP